MYIPHSVNGFGGVRWQPPSKQVSMAVIFISFIFCYKIVLMFYNVISLGEVADFGKINFQLKNKYDAKRKRE